ncbi:MAG: rhodanese-like domain-containing protein [Saprospiraceae bacterium]
MRILTLLLFLMPFLESCKGQTKVTTAPDEITIDIKDIDVPTAKKMLAESNDFVLLDVRTPAEIAKGKIGEALEMDINSPDFNQSLATLDKTKPYIVYCAVGGRSSKAMAVMKELGFTKVYNMMGGYNQWSSPE